MRKMLVVLIIMLFQGCYVFANQGSCLSPQSAFCNQDKVIAVTHKVKLILESLSLSLLPVFRALVKHLEETSQMNELVNQVAQDLAAQSDLLDEYHSFVPLLTDKIKTKIEELKVKLSSNRIQFEKLSQKLEKAFMDQLSSEAVLNNELQNLCSKKENIFCY